MGQWLERFISLDDNPRAARIMGAGSPYSIETIEMYRVKYGRYVKGDPFCDLKMREVEQTHCLAFMGRLGMREKKEQHGGGPIAGTRTYEITLCNIIIALAALGTLAYMVFNQQPGWEGVHETPSLKNKLF